MDETMEYASGLVDQVPQDILPGDNRKDLRRDSRRHGIYVTLQDLGAKCMGEVYK